MVKKEEKETGDFGVKIPEPPEPPKEPPEDKTPTAEEQLAALQQELEQAKSQRDEYKRGLDTSHASHREKDKKLREQADLNARIDELQETQKIFAAMLAEQGQIASEEVDPSKRVDYLKRFDDLAQRQKREREQAQAKAQQDEYNRQADAVWAEAQEVFKDDDESLERIEDLLMSGRLERAQSRLNKAKAKPTDTKEKNVESEEEREKRIREDERKKTLEEHGLWKTEPGSPSGTALNEEKIRENFRNNPNNKAARDAYIELLNRKRG